MMRPNPFSNIFDCHQRLTSAPRLPRPTFPRRYCLERFSTFITVSGFRFQVSGLGFRVSSFEFQVWGFKLRVEGFEFQVSSYKFQVEG